MFVKNELLMRKSRENNHLLEEKSFASEAEGVMNQAACLNRIYRNVNINGLSAEAFEELKADIDFVSSFYNIDKESAVLLAAILEKSATNNPSK